MIQGAAGEGREEEQEEEQEEERERGTPRPRTPTDSGILPPRSEEKAGQDPNPHPHDPPTPSDSGRGLRPPVPPARPASGSVLHPRPFLHPHPTLVLPKGSVF